MEGLPRYWTGMSKNFYEITQHTQRADIVSHAVALDDPPGGLLQLDPGVHGPAAEEAVGLLLAHAVYIHEELLGLPDQLLGLFSSPGNRVAEMCALKIQSSLNEAMNSACVAGRGSL